MSKELEKLTLEQRALNGLANFIIMHGNNDDYDASAIEWHGILKQALTTPTAEEVCKALSDELGVPVYYNQPHRYFYYEVLDIAERNKKEIIICTFTKRSQNHKEETLQIKYDFTPHLITLIGRFYEEVEKANDK